MFPVTSPPAIALTQAAPTYESYIGHDISANIVELQAWIGREIELSVIGRYGENWDGFDAAPPNPLVIGRAIMFLRFLRDRDRANPPLRVSLSPDGFIGLEWLEANRLIRAEINDSDEVEWMIATPGQPTEFRTELFGDPLESGSSRGQSWRPAEAAADEPAFAYGR